MNLQGLVIGFSAFLIIGLFHPIVIKSEYYFGKKVWPIFLLSGLIFILSSLFIAQWFLSSLLGVTGFSALWSIHELFEQEQRVKRGWFPANPQKKE